MEYDNLPEQIEAPKLPHFSNFVKQLIDDEIVTLKSKGATKEVSTCSNEFLSNIFLVPKETGDARPICQLEKPLNHFFFRKLRASTRVRISLPLATILLQLPLKMLILV